MPISYVSGSGDSTKKTTTPAFNPYSFNNPNLPSWLNQWVSNVTNNQIREQIGLSPEYAVPKVTSATPYFKSPQSVPSAVQESSSSSTEATPRSMTDWAKMWQQNWAGKEGRPQWEEAMKLSYPTNANEWTKWVKESDWYKSQNPISGTASGNNISSGTISPAGNNIASGAVAPPNPGSAMSGTQLSTTAPNTGTLGTDINQSPFSPTAGTRKRTSPNKYFNQRWFGTKQIA